MEKTIRSLPVALTETEIDERAAKLARLVRERKELEEERKSVVGDYKERIDSLSIQASSLGRQVETHQEDRPVECFERRNLDRKTMDLIRGDTSEVVESRGLHPSEMQDVLPLKEVETQFG